MATLVYNNRPSLRPTRAFNTLLGQMLRETGGTQPAPSFVPAADIVETAQGFELHLALPGVKKDAVKIEFIDGQLVVSGERANPFAAAKASAAPAAETAGAESETAPVATEAAPRFRRTETNFGPFQRSFRLPDTVNVKNIGAELTDGILRVTLPFDTEKVTKQTIEVR
ncbi:Hsp20/alpha crystallin family protein [Hymenobacter sp. ASUV-10]|uniref:Hsp20/alpha crystallin family protein n=1 Tax=Hymenobacter aranciens TaxID=3063996 RepID=A0ABT9BCB7_9BACT|nr:Hsp20/alpha crystallin family protein [Hymenobacter sp. ASUV-10]MDO7875425.1 Hsp20/alpha crystallin family protein [Hymenobacter sp. ASUV-10]